MSDASQIINISNTRYTKSSVSVSHLFISLIKQRLHTIIVFNNKSTITTDKQYEKHNHEKYKILVRASTHCGHCTACKGFIKSSKHGISPIINLRSIYTQLSPQYQS